MAEKGPRTEAELVEDVFLGERCRRSLARFARVFWPVVEPSREFVWGYYHDAIAAHLEAFDLGLYQNLLINVPPGSTKSILACVMWPAWKWARDPAWRGIFASYGNRLAKRDSRRCRTIVRSPLYRRLFRPGWEMLGDANAVEFYENSATGWRMATTTGAGSTGHRGDATIVDDPHKASEVDSEVKRQAVKDWYFEEFWNRLNDLDRGRRLIIMQRLHEDDLAGAALDRRGLWAPDNPGGWAHLMIPAEFEPERSRPTPIGHEAGVTSMARFS